MNVSRSFRQFVQFVWAWLGVGRVIARSTFSVCVVECEWCSNLIVVWINVWIGVMVQ